MNAERFMEETVEAVSDPKVQASMRRFFEILLREYFAGQAMAALLAGDREPWKGNAPLLAVDAYKLADAMIAERNGGAS